MRPVILVVEDEQAVTLFLKETLADEGFEIQPAGCGDDALNQLGAADGFSAAIVDLGLPDMRGEDVVRRIRERYPDLPLIIATGYDPYPIRAQFRADARLRVLPKPFDTAALMIALEALGVYGGGK